MTIRRPKQIFIPLSVLLVVGLMLLATWGFPPSPGWRSTVARWVDEKPLFVATLIASLGGLLIWLLWKLPRWQVRYVFDVKDRIDMESKAREAITKIVGGAFLLGGLYFTAQTLWTTQEGQITDRFTKAIDQLGKDNLAVRLGGIYALERIARDSEYDHGAVVEVLTTFVREQTQGRLDTSRSLFSILYPKDQEASAPPADIQAILTVLGGRTRNGKRESQPLNLRGSRLRAANLHGAHLEEADLIGAYLERAKLDEAHLERANLGGAYLARASLGRAHLEGAYLFQAFLIEALLIQAHLERAQLSAAHLEGAHLGGAYLEGADLGGAYLERADFRATNLTKAKNLTQAQVDMICIDEHTQLPEGLTRPAPCPTNP